MELLLDGPHILSAATAVPPHRVEQGDTKEFAHRLFAGKYWDLERYLEIYPSGTKEYGAISALGPGFSAEHILFRR